MIRMIAALSRISKLRKIDPREKLTLCIVPILTLGFTKSLVPIVFNIVFFVALHIIYKNSVRITAKFIGGVLGFALLSALPIYFDYGLAGCMLVILKTLSGATCICFLALTTPLDDILFVFSRYNLLRDVCDISKNMERFLILIEEEYRVLYSAIVSRGGFGDFNSKIRDNGKLAGLMFTNTFKRWQEIKQGIDSRCYNGYMPYISRSFKFSIRRLLAICFYNLILIMFVVLI